MDKTGVCSDSRSTVRTDLSLLLECLKFQMKCPDLHKQALLAVHSICEKTEDNVDHLRELGGVKFIYNLSKSGIVHSDVKETALFTLGTLAEANVYCKNSLCQKETFVELAGCLMKEDIPLTQKTASVYLLSILVANNKSGQTLAQTTGCLDILLDLFRGTFPIFTDLRMANATQTHQLWTSVSSALCGCVNNPQNVEGQRICVASFPIIRIWLDQITLPCKEIFQPICSFIAMAVANNIYVQESFSASGGLETLTLVLVRLVFASQKSLLSCQLSVTISITLCACITDNPVIASGLAQYGLVSHLISLLSSPNFDPDDRLSVLLTLGHCTAANEEHQFQFVQCHGLPLIITLLTEDTTDEVRKAATFILQTCKQATMSLGVPGLLGKYGAAENVEAVSKMESLRSSAKELLHRIDLLEKRQMKETEEQDTDPPISAELLRQPSLPQAMALPLHPNKTISTTYRQTNTFKHVEVGSVSNKPQIVRSKNGEKKNGSEWHCKKANLNAQDVEVESNAGVPCSLCRGTGIPISSHQWSPEGGRDPPTPNIVKPPEPVRYSVPKEIKYTHLVELQDHDISQAREISVEEHSLSPNRCAGCVLPFEEVTSRTFASLQSSCYHSCEMHKVLHETTERFRTHHCNLLFSRVNQDTFKMTDPNSDKVVPAEPKKSDKHWKVKKVCLTPICKVMGKDKNCMPKPHWKRYKGPCLTPLKRLHPPQKRRVENNNGLPVDDELKSTSGHCSTRQKRKDFTTEEVCYLLSGVKTFGRSWNSILWSYPFQSGRSNVDLAKKYRQLMATEKNV